MNKDYLTLSDGTQVRIEVNWNAIQQVAESEGIKNLAEFDQISNLPPKKFPKLIYESAKEGERMDGRELQMTENELKEKIRFVQIQRFNGIYYDQSVTDDNLDDAGGKKKAKNRSA